MPELWVERMATEFWEAAGGGESFPRSMESSVIWALPVAIVKLPALSIASVEKWLIDRDMQIDLDGRNRALRGCVVAFSGKGVILLDERDGPDERRFSLAHETAHFIVEYSSPRKLAEERLGVRVLEVLDGLRPPSFRERGSALLSNTPIGVYRHFMSRSAGGDIQCCRVERAEREADRLALELLAPEEAVRGLLPNSPTKSNIVNCLNEYFGLPKAVAMRYSCEFSSVSKSESIRSWLGIA